MSDPVHAVEWRIHPCPSESRIRKAVKLRSEPHRAVAALNRVSLRIRVGIVGHCWYSKTHCLCEVCACIASVEKASRLLESVAHRLVLDSASETAVYYQPTTSPKDFHAPLRQPYPRPKEGREARMSLAHWLHLKGLSTPGK